MDRYEEEYDFELPEIEEYERQTAYEEQIRTLEYQLRRADDKRDILARKLDIVKTMFEELAKEYGKVNSSYDFPDDWQRFWEEELN